MAKNQELLIKCQKEIDGIIFTNNIDDGDCSSKNEGFFPNEKDLNNLPFINACWKEGLRLHTAGIGTIRTVPEDVTYCNGKYFFPKHSNLMCFNLGPHRLEKNFKNSLKFQPERWLVGSPEANPSIGKYFPFSGGPRDCIGKSFADYEASFILATLIKRYHIVLKPGFEFKEKLSLTYFPINGVHLIFTKR